MTGTSGFGGSPWAKDALFADQERTAQLELRATELRVRVSIVGKSPPGPWSVNVWTSARGLRFTGRELHDTIAFGLDRWAAGADDTGIRWLAGSDGLAHGQVERGRAVWTLCHRPALDEKFRHPERARCRDCWLALDRRVAAAGAA